MADTILQRVGRALRGGQSTASAVPQDAAPPASDRSSRGSRYSVTRPRRRSVEGAEHSNLFANWSTSPVSINATIFQSLTGLRARSRERAINDPYARRFLGLVRHNVVGPTGPRLISQVRNARGKSDRPAARAIEEAWRRWTTTKACDIAGRLSFREMCNCVIADTAQDGEALVRVWKGRVAGEWGIALQVLDADHLDVTYNRDLGDGRLIVMGVELDIFRRPVAYWFREPGHDLLRSSAKPIRYRIEASEIHHLYLPEKSGQVRGIPWFVAALKRMHMLHGYHTDAAKAARFGANSNLFITTPSGNDVVAGAEETDEGNLEIEISEDLVAHQLREGEEIQKFDPAYPHDQFSDFTKAVLRSISSALGVPYNSLANDLEGVNYSSIRAGELEVREAWKALQQWLFESFCAPVFEAWLEVALLNGMVLFDGRRPLSPTRFEKYRRHSWQGKRWSWVDPLKDVNANKTLHELNALSLGQIVESMGGDLEETLERIAAEREDLDRLGLQVPSVPAGTGSPADPEMDPDAEDGDGNAE